MSDRIDSVDHVRDRLSDERIAMVTSIDEQGTLSARPLTIQEIDATGDVWFLVDRQAEWVPPLAGGPVNAAVVDDRTWVSFAGRAVLVDDSDRIDALADPISSSFFDDGAVPVALRVATDRIEWWAAPNKAVQIIEIAKAAVTDSRPDLGDSGTIDV